MRFVTAFGGLLLLHSQTACAKPWGEHERLAASGALVFLRHAQTTHELGATRTLLTKLADQGFACDAFGAQLQEITIRCTRPSGPRPIRVVYMGSFGSGTNLIIGAIWIDGRALRESERLTSLTKTFAAGEP